MNEEDTRILKVVLAGFTIVLGMMVVAAALIVNSSGHGLIIPARSPSAKKITAPKPRNTYLPGSRRILMGRSWSLQLPTQSAARQEHDDTRPNHDTFIRMRWQFDVKNGQLEIDPRKTHMMKSLIYRTMSGKPLSKESDPNVRDDLRELLWRAWDNLEEFGREGNRTLARMGEMPTFLPEVINVAISVTYHPESGQLDMSVKEAD